MRGLKTIYYWLISPDHLEEIPGIKEGYAARLRKAGVESPSELYRRIRSAEALGMLVKETALDRNMLLRAVERWRKPWYRNYKVMGVVAIIGIVVGIVSGFLTYKARTEANDAGKKLEKVVNEIRRDETAAWSLEIEAELWAAPKDLYNEYYADVARRAGPIFIGPDGKVSLRNLTESDLVSLLNLTSEETARFFIGRWFSFKSETTNDLFAGVLLVHLSESPPLRLEIHACSKLSQRPPTALPTRDRRQSTEKESRPCEPMIRLIAPNSNPVFPTDTAWVRLGENSRTGWSAKFKNQTAPAPAGREPVTLYFSFGQEDMGRFIPSIGRLNVGAFKQTPSIEFCLPAARSKKVENGDKVSFVADVPEDVVKRATDSLPDRINLMLALNDDPTLEHYCSYALNKTPKYLADAVCFETDLKPM